MDIVIRTEKSTDQLAIYDLTKRAFSPMPFAAGEEDLINALRNKGALALSLVAEQNGKICGHLALSPATHDSESDGWFALGPISVEPELQRTGIGSALIGEAKAWLQSYDAKGCILTGDTNYYSRHGFLRAAAS